MANLKNIGIHGKWLRLMVSIFNISSNGFWLYVKDKEYFLSYEEYPWFKEARIKDILNVKLLRDFHLYWPDLDVDLEVNCLENTANYPLKYK
jgi:hypothetical protein